LRAGSRSSVTGCVSTATKSGPPRSPSPPRCSTGCSTLETQIPSASPVNGGQWRILRLFPPSAQDAIRRGYVDPPLPPTGCQNHGSAVTQGCRADNHQWPNWPAPNLAGTRWEPPKAVRSPLARNSELHSLAVISGPPMNLCWNRRCVLRQIQDNLAKL
jgi:hypothetical protein